MKKRHLLPVLVGIGASVSGCDDKPSTSETVEKDRPVKTAKKKTAQSTAPTAKETTSPSATDPSATAPSATATATAKPKPTIIIRENDPIPRRLAGAPRRMPAPRPALRAPRAPSRPGQANKPAPAPAPAPAPIAVSIVHDHPPDEPCQPLTDADVKKALDDIRAGR